MTQRLWKTMMAMRAAEQKVLSSMLGGFRGSSTASVMINLASKSDTLSDAVSNEYLAFQALLHFRLKGFVPPGLLEKALHYNDAVRALIRVEIDDLRLLKRAEEIYSSNAVAIRRGADLVEDVAEQLVMQRPRLRALAQAREANAPSPALIRQVEASVIEALGDVRSVVRGSAPHQKSVQEFLDQVEVNGGIGQQRICEALAELIDRLARSRRARSKWLEWVEPPDLTTFVQNFGPQRNYIKGILGEIWFEQARHTEALRELLFRRALGLERRLNTRDTGLRAFRADYHVGPLYDPVGLQILDGIYFVGRPSQLSDDVLEVYLSAAIEVKTGTRRTNAFQLRRDQVRELGLMYEGLIVRASSGQRFRIMPSPEGEGPIRLFVAPKPPPRSVMRSLESRGVNILPVPLLPTSEDFGRVADFFLLAMLARY
jgi:hypothetical protein